MRLSTYCCNRVRILMQRRVRVTPLWYFLFFIYIFFPPRVCERMRAFVGGSVRYTHTPHTHKYTQQSCMHKSHMHTCAHMYMHPSYTQAHACMTYEMPCRRTQPTAAVCRLSQSCSATPKTPIGATHWGDCACAIVFVSSNAHVSS